MMENPRYTISPEAIANGINDLLDEKEELQERIDKAIEYIENELPYLEMVDYEYEDMNGDIKYVMKEWEGKELLDILKGSDSNE